MPFLNAQPYSNPSQDSQIVRAWRAFLRGEYHAGLGNLRPVVGFSWQRCHDAHVNPNQQNAPILGEGAEMLSSIQKELLDASLPVMKEARAYLAESGSIMALADAQARILRTEGDTRTLGQAEDINFLPGAGWGEQDCGTNAIGTALAIGQPIQVHSAEHYCEGIQRWSCSAAVIRNPVDNAIAGAVDLSGLSSSYARQNLALAVQMAGRIESRLMEAELQWRYRLLDAAMNRLSDAGRDGVLLFDRRGRLLKTNDKAAQVLMDSSPAGRRLASLTLEVVARFEGRIDTSCSSVRLDFDAARQEAVVVNGHTLGTVVIVPARSRYQAAEVVPHAAPAMPRATVWNTQANHGPQEQQQTAAGKGAFASVVGRSAAIAGAIATARQLAPSRVSVLLLGDTGVGKEVFAKALHDEHMLASGKTAPFVAINCGGMSRELLSSELFGYAEGAFTGARRGGMVGKIEAADGGTLFLDEIGEMPLDLQPHFLRVLEESEVHRLGETRPRKVNFRLVAATHRNLQEEVRAGRFRMDLFYRIAVTTIRLPSLRDRQGDIPLLVTHYLQQLADIHQVARPAIAPQVLDALQAYAWPGNVRELRNALEAMVLTCKGGMIELPDLPHTLLQALETCQLPRHAEVAAMPPVASVAPAATLADGERDALMRSIRLCHGNLTAVAKQLGIAKSTVYLKVQRYQLQGAIDAIRRIPARREVG